VVSIYSMVAKASNVALALLFSCCCARASPRCGAEALHDQVMTAADANMGPFVLFRGQVQLTPQEKKHVPSNGGTCCVDKACPNVQCAMPSVKIKPYPVTYLDYTVNETLWGGVAKLLIHGAHQLPTECGSFTPVPHQNVIAFCSVFAGWPDNGPMYCDLPIADTEENLWEVRQWIPQAIKLQQREKISEEEARAHLIYRTDPIYPRRFPPIDKMKGDVVVRVFINEQGTIRSVRAISGPAELGQLAINAVSLWQFKPFLINGRPARIDTTVTVHFPPGMGKAGRDSSTVIPKIKKRLVTLASHETPEQPSPRTAQPQSMFPRG
jgi:TonB family protein